MLEHSSLKELLVRYGSAEDADERKAIEKETWDRFGITEAVCVFDMQGFSRITQERGIVHYLTMIRRMQMIVNPLIARYSGNVVKYEADNCFARFPNVKDAMDAALGIRWAIREDHAHSDIEKELVVSCGIDHGPFLLVDDHDFFGNVVNRASKLGEDLACGGEILVTREAVETMPSRKGYFLEETEYSISEIELKAYRVRG